MKATDLRERTTDDLKELERSLADERFQGQFKNFTNRLDDTSLIRKTRRDLARVKLILAERIRGAEPVVAKPKPVPAKKAEPKGEKAEKPAKKKAPRAEAEASAEHAAKPAKKAAEASSEAPAEPKAEKKTKSKPKSTEKAESK
jgi:large subunit ribosomal protein L29